MIPYVTFLLISFGSETSRAAPKRDKRWQEPEAKSTPSKVKLQGSGTCRSGIATWNRSSDPVNESITQSPKVLKSNDPNSQSDLCSYQNSQHVDHGYLRLFKCWDPFRGLSLLAWNSMKGSRWSHWHCFVEWGCRGCFMFRRKSMQTSGHRDK